MSSEYLWSGLVRKVVSRIGAGITRPLPLTGFGSLATAQVEGPDTELLRMGLRFVGGCQVIASGIAPVAAIPTTTATLALYNTASAGGKSLVVRSVSFTLGSGTPAAGATLFLGVSAGATAAVPSAASNYSSQCATGDTSRTALARWATAVTIPANTAWIAARPQFQLAAVNVGQGDAPWGGAGGRFLIPPTYALGIAILSGAGTTPLYTVSAEWDEVDIDLVLG